MNASRKPRDCSGMSLLVTALSLTLAMPVLAAPATTKPGATASKHKTARTKAHKPQLAKEAPAAAAAAVGNTVAAKPAAAVAVSQSAMQPAVIAPTQALSAAPAVAVPAAAIAASAVPAVAVTAVPVAPRAAPADQKVNPYLAGWYRPIPAAALPAVAVGQLNYNVRYVSDSVTSIPGKLADALPSIKTVHPTGGRDLVVANLKCPVEMVTGQYLLPANAMREGVNGLFGKLNETQLLKFDIQLVCS